jgi:hypothetical protein
MRRIDRRQALFGAGAAAVGAVAACGVSAPKEPISDTGKGGGPSSNAPAVKRATLTSTIEENRKKGDPRWRIDRLGALHEIEGWADRTSVRPGEHVGLHISTTAKTYRVSVARTGYYQGCFGRHVWQSGVLQGEVGAPPRIIGPTNTVVTDWPVSVTLDTTGWVPGFYSIRLDADTGGQRYIMLAVKSGDAHGKVVLLNADTTWQAYNIFGGYSLYLGPSGFATRARAVTFDRPYGGNEGAQGDGEFMVNVLPLVALVEGSGYEAEYLSDTDLHADPHCLDGAVAVLSPGHDEYYSVEMRQRLMDARDKQGTNIAFLGANAVYRHIRLGPTTVGANRLQTCYKVPQEDPLYGKDNSVVTGQWRYDPDPRPESVLTGVFYESNPCSADMVVRNPKHWLFAGTGAYDGMTLPGLVGAEYDRVNLSVPTPRPIEVLARSPLICNGVASHSDMAYYTVPSGAGVLATGSNWWIQAIGGSKGMECHHFTGAVTKNMLKVFARGPAGRQHPAVDNLVSLGVSSSAAGPAVKTGPS